MKENKETLTFEQKVLNVQKKVRYIKKKGTMLINNKPVPYARERDVVSAIRSVAIEEGLMCYFDTKREKTEIRQTENLDILEFVEVTLVVKDIHGPYTATVSSPGTGRGIGGNADKAVYKAIAGGRKYCLLNFFMIETGEEDDPEFENLEKEKEENSRKYKNEMMRKAKQFIKDKPHIQNMGNKTGTNWWQFAQLCIAVNWDEDKIKSLYEGYIEDGHKAGKNWELMLDMAKSMEGESEQPRN